MLTTCQSRVRLQPSGPKPVIPGTNAESIPRWFSFFGKTAYAPRGLLQKRGLLLKRSMRSVGLMGASGGMKPRTMWGDWWLEPLPADSTICAAGEIYLYEGVTFIELDTPGELEIWQ